MATDRQTTIAIIGTGLIGGAILKCFATTPWVDCTVNAFDPNPKTARGINEWSADPAVRNPVNVHGSGVLAVQNADVVFIATPIDTINDVVRSIAHGLGRGTILTDTASVKESITSEVSWVVNPLGVTYVPGHPMAGSQFHGFDHSSPEMFLGARWILCPRRKGTATPGVDELRQLLTLALGIQGDAILLEDAALHDRKLAAISHGVQLAASAAAAVIWDLIEKAGPGDRREYQAGLRVKQATRISASAFPMWHSVLQRNQAVVKFLEELATSVKKIQGLVKNQNWIEFKPALLKTCEEPENIRALRMRHIHPRPGQQNSLGTQIQAVLTALAYAMRTAVHTRDAKLPGTKCTALAGPGYADSSSYLNGPWALAQSLSRYVADSSDALQQLHLKLLGARFDLIHNDFEAIERLFGQANKAHAALNQAGQ